MAQSVSERFREIAARFRRINSPDDDTAERMVRATGASAAQCYKLGTESGEIETKPGFELPWPAPSDRMLSDQTPQWFTIWSAIVLGIQQNFPGELPSNPIAIRFQGSSLKTVGAGATDRRDWRIRAENFAQLCDFIAGRLESAEKQNNPRSKLPENADAVALMNHLRTAFGTVPKSDVTAKAVEAENAAFFASRQDIKKSEHATIKRYARDCRWYWEPQ